MYYEQIIFYFELPKKTTYWVWDNKITTKSGKTDLTVIQGTWTL